MYLTFQYESHLLFYTYRVYFKTLVTEAYIIVQIYLQDKIFFAFFLEYTSHYSIPVIKCIKCIKF